MKRIVSVLLVAFALFLGGCGAGTDVVNEDYKFDNLNGRIVNLQTQIADLQTQLDQLAGGDNVVVVDQETINQIFADISALQTQVNELETQLSELSGAIDNVDARVADLEKCCDDVKEALGSLDGRIKALENAVEALQNAQPPTSAGSYLFVGAGAPVTVAGARAGDFYIDLNLTGIGNDNKGHTVYILTSSGWEYFGTLVQTKQSAPVIQ